MKNYLLLILGITPMWMYGQLNPKDTIRKIVVYFQTSNDILSGTNNDVWFDIGPKAWRVPDGFERGTIKEFVIANPNKFGPGASTTEEEVPLLVEDIKLIRIEKKGIRLCDIVPVDINVCNDMGGLSNAPDHALELVTPDVVTPAGQVAELQKNIATADAIVIQEQGAQAKATKVFQDISNKVSSYEAKIKELSKKVAAIPAEATQVHSQLLDVRQKVLNVPTKIITQICREEHKTVRRVLGGLFGGVVGVLVTEVVCHNEEVINPAWTNLTQTITDLEKQQIKLAGEAGAKALEELTEAQLQLSGFRTTKLTIDLELKTHKAALAAQRKILDRLTKDLRSIEQFIREKLPFLSLDMIPKVNQWKLEHVTVYVNNKLFGSYHVHKRFKAGSSSWITYLDNQEDPVKFLNSLRVNANKAGDTKDGIIASVSSPWFKERNISGWDRNGIVGYGTVIGTLINEPNRGFDGFVSLDIKIDTAIINGKKYIMDGKHTIKHTRYIRAEYLRVKPSGSVDDSFNKLQVGQKLKISGEVRRDLDRHTYFELHPVFASEIEVLK